jgi:hypothetical protein
MSTPISQNPTLERVLFEQDGDGLESCAKELGQSSGGLPQRVNADPEGVEQGLAKLVLTLIELIRRMLEHQALRRMEGGSLSDEEIERLGETFMKLEQRMEELKQAFHLEGEELNLNLGPLGDLM